MDTQPANSNDHAKKLSAEIKKTWSKLTDQEIGFYTTDPEKFFAATTKLGVSEEEAKKTVKKLDAECAAACSTDKAAAPTAKAS